jgi:hypothetical protein
MGRAELTGWEALYEGSSDTPTIEDKGFEGTPIIIEEKRVEGLPEMFIYDSVLIVG